MSSPAQPDRDARLEARLAAYTRYAATVAEQFTAALHGDAERAGALGEERELLGEHYAELCEHLEPAGEPAFGTLLADAIVELDHQVGIELALRQRIAAVRDEALRLLYRGGDGARHQTPASALAALDPADVSAGALGALLPPAGREIAVRPRAPRPPAAPREQAASPAAPRLNIRG